MEVVKTDNGGVSSTVDFIETKPVDKQLFRITTPNKDIYLTITDDGMYSHPFEKGETTQKEITDFVEALPVKEDVTVVLNNMHEKFDIYGRKTVFISTDKFNSCVIIGKDVDDSGNPIEPLVMTINLPTGSTPEQLQSIIEAHT